MTTENAAFFDGTGNQVAEVAVREEVGGWFYGDVLSQQFSTPLAEALRRYDEVVENQVLSVLDDALAAVDQFGLRVRYANGAVRKVYSLQINRQNEVCFRTTPVPAPAWLPKSESA